MLPNLVSGKSPTRRTVLVCSAVFLAHIAAVLWHFPLQFVMTGQPLASGDSAITLGKAWDTAEGSKTGGLVGYSPSFMAGYPYGTWNSVGHRGYELGSTYLPFGSPPTRYYLTVVGMTILTPLLLGFASRVCGHTWATAAGCVAFGCAVVQLCDPVSYFWSFGNTAFPFASALAVVAVSFSLPAGGRISFARAAAAGLFASAAVWAHTISAVPLLCGGLAAIVIARRAGTQWARLGALVVITAGVAAAVVVPGHWHLLSYLGERAPMFGNPLPSGMPYLVMDLLNDRAYRHPMDRRPFFHLLLVFATWQSLHDWRTRAGRSEGFWLAGVLTLLFGYAAGHVPFLKQLQPYRFVVSGELFLAVPAYLGLIRLVSAIRAANPPGRAAFVLVGVAFAPSLMGHVWDGYTRPRSQGLSAEANGCVEWIRSHPGSGRICCEPGSLGCLLPHLTGREVIGGGVSSQAVLVQGWTHVGDGRAFGRSFGNIAPTDFLRACRLLDIRLIIVESVELEGLVKAMPADVQKETEVGRFRIYRLAPTPAPEIWEGCYHGRVTVTHNRIRINSPPVGRFVINYHYASGFQVDSGIVVEPLTVPGASAPFIGVVVSESRPAIELAFQP